MRIGVALSPVARWDAILEAARVADEGGIDAVGFWDHYHSERPEWSYVSGWAAHAALAMVTSRIALTPMVLCRPNHLLGVLAKESSMLAIMSGGRFELAIGAGDYEVEFRAWDVPFPDAETRIATLEESVGALRELWKGGAVDFDGTHVRLASAASTPVPPSPPRVVVGVGGSRRMLESALGYADEVNVYADRELVREARQRIDDGGRPIGLSVYRHLEFGAWPADLHAELARWGSLGAERVFVNVGFGDDLTERVRELAAAAG